VRAPPVFPPAADRLGRHDSERRTAWSARPLADTEAETAGLKSPAEARHRVTQAQQDIRRKVSKYNRPTSRSRGKPEATNRESGKYIRSKEDRAPRDGAHAEPQIEP